MGKGRISRGQRYAEASRLRAKGLYSREIAAAMGISLSYVRGLFNDPDGAKDRARKNSYGGVCLRCGKRTDGSNGRAKAPKICAACDAIRLHEERYWTRERVIAAIQRWAAEHGRPPRANEWQRAHPDGWWPAATSVYRTSTNPGAVFAYWADAIEAAGFPRPEVGKYERTSETRRRSSESLKRRYAKGAS